MVQQENMLTATPDYLRLMLGTHTVEKGQIPTICLLTSASVLGYTHVFECVVRAHNQLNK